VRAGHRDKNNQKIKVWVGGQPTFGLKEGFNVSVKIKIVNSLYMVPVKVTVPQWREFIEY
jgi:hypothetical protein